MEKYRLVQEHKASEGDDEYDVGSGSGGAGGPTTMTRSSPPQHAYAAAHHPPQTLALPEVRITQQGKPRNYISYAMNLFADGSSVIVLKAMGRAINKAVTIAEILKRKMPLHQLNLLSSVEMIDVYEPVEEGLDVVTSHRYVSCMKITLSLTADLMDVNHPGYQPPLASADDLGSEQPMQLPPSSPPPHARHHQHGDPLVPPT